MKKMYKYLEIKKFYEEKPVKRSDVTGKSLSQIEVLETALNRNLNHREYFTILIESEKRLDIL